MYKAKDCGVERVITHPGIEVSQVPSTKGRDASGTASEEE
jgi:endonuclease IV